MGSTREEQEWGKSLWSLWDLWLAAGSTGLGRGGREGSGDTGEEVGPGVKEVQ